MTFAYGSCDWIALTIAALYAACSRRWPTLVSGPLVKWFATTQTSDAAPGAGRRESGTRPPAPPA